ncbi:MAG: hypothetical protein U9N84_09465, partial [Actinomycetota bacterium]|nr:hypothetical protein [Actinomycetota bacterium]
MRRLSGLWSGGSLVVRSVHQTTARMSLRATIIAHHHQASITQNVTKVPVRTAARATPPVPVDRGSARRKRHYPDDELSGQQGAG